MQPSEPPEWVREELARREQAAREKYRKLFLRLCREEEYVRMEMAQADYEHPLTWTTSGTGE